MRWASVELRANIVARYALVKGAPTGSCRKLATYRIAFAPHLLYAHGALRLLQILAVAVFETPTILYMVQ